MNTEVRDVTPHVAKEMLKRNANNRNCSESHVNFLANEMTLGNWMFDGQPIRFSEGGTLLDGQHRLNAIIKSDTAQKFLILKGIDSNSFRVMDTGRTRSTSDTFSINGMVNSTACAAATKFIMNHGKGHNSKGNDRISNTQALNYFNENPIIAEYVTTGITYYKAFNKVLNVSMLSGMMYLTSRKNITDSEEFWRKVCYGLALTNGDPALTLRNKLISDKMSKSTLPTREKKALIVKAWNQHRAGRKSSVLRWNKESEKFPVII